MTCIKREKLASPLNMRRSEASCDAFQTLQKSYNEKTLVILITCCTYEFREVQTFAGLNKVVL